MNAIVDGSLAMAGLVSALMVSVFAIRGTEPREVSPRNSVANEPLQVKKAA